MNSGNTAGVSQCLDMRAVDFVRALVKVLLGGYEQ